MSFSPDDLDLLQDFLAEHVEHEQCMPLDMLHGFLTAVVSGPRDITDNEWQQVALGDMSLDASQQAQTLFEAMARLKQHIIEELKKGEFGLMIPEYDDDQENLLPLPYGWCQGYLEGLTLHDDDLINQLGEKEESADPTSIILFFLMYEDEQMLNPNDRDQHIELTKELPAAALDLYDWFQAKKSSNGHKSSAPKPAYH